LNGRPLSRIVVLWAPWAETRAREAVGAAWEKVGKVMRTYQFCALGPGLLAARSHGCWCCPCVAAAQEGPAASGLRAASAANNGAGAGLPSCRRASDPYFQWRDEKCQRVAGAGVGANIQEVRKAGHRRAADLVVGTWLLIEHRERTHDIGKLWLARCVAVREWSQSCRKRVVLPKGKKWINLYGSRWDAGDWMMGVQYYSENDDGSFVQGEPHLDVCNSSELRLAGFELEQSCGLRQINARPRRGEQAAHQAELEADAAWLLPPATRGIAEAACREVAED